MRTVTFARIGLVGAAVLLSLIAIWLILLPIGPAQSIGYRPRAAPSPAKLDQTTSALITDTHWLELIRSAARQPVMRRPLATAPTLHIHLTDGFVAGRVAAGSNVIISITRASAGIVHVVATPFPDGDGYMYLYSLNSIYFPCPLEVYGGGGCYFYFQPGDVVQVTQANATISMTAPELTGLADTTNDTVYGTAPLSQPVTIYLYPFSTPEVYYTRTATAAVNGQYRAVWSPALDVRPRDSGYVAYAETPDRQAYARFVAPFLRAQNGGPDISGLAAPRSPVLITVTNSGGLARNAYAYTAADGSFTAYTDYWPKLLILQPGDRIVAVSAGQAFTMTVAPITAQSDLAHRQVRGAAAPGQLIGLLRFTGPLACCGSAPFWNQTPPEQVVVTATVSGQYTAALALARPDYGAAIVTSADGYQTYARFAVPYIAVRMGATNVLHYTLEGQVDDPSAPITIAIQGPSGYYKDVRYAGARSDGYFYDESYGLTLDSGDVITVTTPRGVQTALILPHLTGQIDPETDIVSGAAPPGARLTLTVYYNQSIPPILPPTPTPSPPATPEQVTGGGYPPTYPYTVIVTATAQGEYQVNLHGIVDLTRDSTASVAYMTAAGHSVTRVFPANPQDCLLALRDVHVGGNTLRVVSDFSCRQSVNVTLRLRDAQGRLKIAQQFTLYPYTWWYGGLLSFYTNTVPIYILPGDVIELQYQSQVSLPPPTPAPLPTKAREATNAAWFHASDQAAGDQFVTYRVPALTAVLDPAANIVKGQAPAGSIVSIQLYREWSEQRALTATVNAQGVYSLSLSGTMTLTAGDRAQVSYAPSYALGVIPLLRARLHDPLVSGWLPPVVPFTGTQSFGGPVFNGYSHSDGSFSMVLAAVSPGNTIAITTPQRVLRLAVPFLSAQIERATATVSGQAPPAARLAVQLNYRRQEVTATAGGVYAAVFADLAPLFNAIGTLTYFDPGGNQALLDFATPRWSVYLDDRCVSGIASVAGAPITITLQRQNGAVKGVVTTTSQLTAGSFYGCFTVTVQSTDRLMLKPAAGIVSTFVVPVLTARHDYARLVLKGEAPANTEIGASFSPWLPSTSRRTWSDGLGNYGLDTSDLSLSPGMGGYAEVTDEMGDVTRRNFSITGYRVFLPVMRR